MSGSQFPGVKEKGRSVDTVDMELLVLLEDGLPLVPEPFDEIGRNLGMSGSEVIARIRRLIEKRAIRKFRARLNQRKVGITANALVAWKRKKSLNGDMEACLSAFPSVTHCYERLPVPGKWDYTIYTVHHGCSYEDVLGEIKALSDQVGAGDYVVLFSTEEFKRVPNVRVREYGGLKR